jgi:hypothetical protein
MWPFKKKKTYTYKLYRYGVVDPYGRFAIATTPNREFVAAVPSDKTHMFILWKDENEEIK